MTGSVKTDNWNKINLDDVEMEIVEAIKDAVRRNWRLTRDKSWTRELKAALCNLGHQSGYKVYGAGTTGADYGEWMYDLCWVKEGENWKDFKGMRLICEIEWRTDEESILEDFHKIVVGVADYRLFIYSHKNLERQKQIVDWCKNACLRDLGFRYLTIGIPEKDDLEVKVDNWML